jgi:hypothetical protein
MAIIFNIGEALKLSAFNVLQEPVKMLMEKETEAFEKGSKISEVYVMKTTDKYQEEFRSRTAMDGFKPTEDLEPAGLSDFGEGYRKVFRTQIWTNSFVISKQAIEDNQMLDINASAVGFIKSYHRTREDFAFQMLADAVTTTTGFSSEYHGKKFDLRGGDTKDGSVDGTGEPQMYFHNAHKLAGDSSKTFSNKFKTSAKVDLSTAGSVETLIDAIDQVADKMAAYTDEKGNLLALRPTKILIPGGQSKLRAAIETGLKSKYGTALGGNGINTFYGAYEIVELPYLNGKDGFKLADQGIILMDPQANREYLGAVWFDRKPLEIDSYVDKGNKANVWDGRARFGVGFNNARAMAYLHTGGASGTTANAYANAEAITPAPLAGGAIATVSKTQAGA